MNKTGTPVCKALLATHDPHTYSRSAWRRELVGEEVEVRILDGRSEVASELRDGPEDERALQ